MVKKVSVSKRTSLPKSVMKAKGTFQPNEGFGKTHRAEKTETRYFPGPLRKLISSTGSKVTTRSASSFGNFISFRKKPQVLKFARKKVAKNFGNLSLYSVSRIVPKKRKVVSFRRKYNSGASFYIGLR